MAVDQQTPPAHSSAYSAVSRADRLTGGGTTGNERLTAATGAMLIALLAVLGVTILRVRPLLSVHLFVGMLLIPPVMLKMGTTGYRFVRYYTADPAYRSKGPPEALMRALAPLVVLTTVIVFASGVALLFVGPDSRGTLLPIHRVSFIAWLAFRSDAGAGAVGRAHDGDRVRQRRRAAVRGARLARNAAADPQGQLHRLARVQIGCGRWRRWSCSRR